MLLGALPFDTSAPAALLVPNTVLRTDGPPDWPTSPLPAVHVAAAVPPPDDYRVRISRARDRLAAPGSTLRKVVLARALQLVANAPVDARVVLRRLIAADPAGYGYLVDLTGAGDDYAGAALVGATPWWAPLQNFWSRVPATVSSAARSPVRRRAPPTRTSTPLTAPR